MRKLGYKTIKQSCNGFSLLELLVVLVIMGILTSIAFPAYTSYVARSKLTEAVSNLQDMRLSMEQFYQDNRTYLQANNTCALTMPVLDNFTVTCINNTRRTYTLNASNVAGVGLGAAGDYVYTLDQDGVATTVEYAGATVNEACLRVSNTC